jgi:hypothetical protein
VASPGADHEVEICSGSSKRNQAMKSNEPTYRSRIRRLPDKRACGHEEIARLLVLVVRIADRKDVCRKGNERRPVSAQRGKCGDEDHDKAAQNPARSARAKPVETSRKR